MDWGGVREGESTQRCRDRGKYVRRDRKERDKVTENKRPSMRPRGHREKQKHNRQMGKGGERQKFHPCKESV